MNLMQHITSFANANPHKPALLICEMRGVVQKTITWGELIQRINSAAVYLRNLGLREGDRVALDFGNSAEFLILSWAAWSFGIVTVPLDIKRDTKELRDYKIEKSQAKAVLTSAQSDIAPAFVPAYKESDGHEALILFTSGTTAHPKGVSLSLHNLVVNAQDIATWLHITPRDCFLVQLPLHHINSTTFCFATMLAGGSIAIPPTYSNSHFWEQVANSGATITSIVQSIVFDQLSRTEEFNRVKNRVLLSRIQIGSAPVVPQTVKEFMRYSSIPLYQGYGQTETALRVTGVPMDTNKALYDQLVLENSIGEALPWANIQIAEDGELLVKGPAVMHGYIGSEEAFKDGFFATGDIGYTKTIQGRQFFFLKGRKKEMIIKGGINISPVAVENCIKRLSDTIDQVYVVGISDKRFGEEVGAIVVWKDGVDEKSAMRSLKLTLLGGTPYLSNYETPRFLKNIKKDELPTTSTGKVQRTVLKTTSGFSSVYELFENAIYKFVAIDTNSSLAFKSHILFNHCWQPLGLDWEEYKKFLQSNITLGAIAKDESLDAQIAFSYEENVLACNSVCSKNYIAKPFPEVRSVPKHEIVEQYLKDGLDPVMNFHTKLGATLVEVVPQGRPSDARSLGYVMLLRYQPGHTVNERGSAAAQLVEVVRLLAQDTGSRVDVYSRPGGLASYVASL